MEHSKKFIMIPEERAQLIDHLSELDHRMKSILQAKDLSESEKAALYLQILQKYTTIEKLPNENIKKLVEENQKGDPLEEENASLDVKKEIPIEEKILHAVPIRYKETAKKILQFLKSQSSLQWTENGRIIYQDREIPRTNIVTLVNGLLRNKKSAPSGQTVFINALRDLKFPANLDIKKKLYDENKIAKPILYARRKKTPWIQF